MSSEREILLPDIGDFDSVDVIEVVVGPGDQVDIDDTLLTLESDKATMDIPSPAAGTIKEMKVSVGDKVTKGAVIMILKEASLAEQVANPEPETQTTSTKNDALYEVEIAVPDKVDLESVEVREIGVAVGDDVDTESTLISL